MNRNGKSSSIVVVLAIIGIAGLIWYLYSGAGTATDAFDPGKGKIINGYWNAETQECWPDKNTPIDGPFSLRAGFDETFYQCCFNKEQQQVDCNDASKLLNTFAIYQGQTGMFFVAHGIKVRNTGNVILDRAWIESATWTPTSSELDNAYAGIIGSTHSKGPLCLTEECDEVAWSTGLIDLQTIGGAAGTPKTYTLDLVTKASSAGLPDASQTTPATITVEKEGIAFSVEVTLGA